MPPSNIHLVQNYNFGGNDYLLFDANVWLIIDGPILIMEDTYVWKIEAYSKLLKNARNAGSKLFINEIIAGEYFNKFVQAEMESLGLVRYSKKRFRFKPEYSVGITNAVNHLKDVFKRTEKLDMNFRQLNLEELKKWMIERKCDFNDALIAKFCIENKLKLITDDRDFSKFTEFEIITANKRLLQDTE